MKKQFALAAMIAAALSSAASAAVSFSPFVIRNASAPVTPLTIADVAGVVTTNIDESGEKTGYGTTYFNGMSIRSLGTISYNRLDAGTKTPYLNVWVTDGTHYAVIAPNVYTSYGAGGAPVSTNINGLNLQSLGVNVYETSFGDLSWLAPGAVYNSAFQGLATLVGGQYVPVKVSDLFASLTIYGNTTLGSSGATKSGTGVSLIFGDTQGNFVQPLPYVISNVDATAVVPLPAAAVAGLALLGKLGLARRRNPVA